MSKAKDLREAALIAASVGKAVSETAKAIRAEASQAAANPVAVKEVANSGPSDPGA